MKSNRWPFLLISLAISLSSAARSFAAEVKADYGHSADFGRYKTFCWQKIETKYPLWIERVRTAVGSALTEKGWTQTESRSGCGAAIVAGSATDTLSNKTDKNIKQLKSSVHKLFEHFPPQQQSRGCCSAAECAAQHRHMAVEAV